MGVRRLIGSMNHELPGGHCGCSCCSAAHTYTGTFGLLNRRDFIFRVGTAGAGMGLGMASLDLLAADPTLDLPSRGPLPARPLKVQPVLTYAVPQRREGTSWRGWGGIQTEAQAGEEMNRITAELEAARAKAGFPMEILPIVSVRTRDQAVAAAKNPCDVRIVYAAGGGTDMLEAAIQPDKWNIMFLRHDPGPVYLWYEIAHPWFMRKSTDEYMAKGLALDDIVVDSQDAILARLRGLHGLHNTLGKRIVAIGGAGGWGVGGRKAPEISRTLWKLDIVDCPYKELEPRLKSALGDAGMMKRCQAAAARYLKGARVSLHTKREFIDNAFVLNEVMKDVMDEAKTDAITVNNCMGTIMGVSRTTACLPLSMLNDDGYLAFCESDFVVIPSGILLHYISGLPVFLNDPTTPHENIVTLAHCTAPRKMDGKRAERVKIMTHFESDYGAAPKVEMRLGQVCTNLVPDFACQNWVGFEGKIAGNPFLDICRSQIEMKVTGDNSTLLRDMRGFHWMMSYGNHLKETGYALGKLGVKLQNISQAEKA